MPWAKGPPRLPSLLFSHFVGLVRDLDACLVPPFFFLHVPRNPYRLSQVRDRPLLCRLAASCDTVLPFTPFSSLPAVMVEDDRGGSVLGEAQLLFFPSLFFLSSTLLARAFFSFSFFPRCRKVRLSFPLHALFFFFLPFLGTTVLSLELKGTTSFFSPSSDGKEDRCAHCR